MWIREVLRSISHIKCAKNRDQQISFNEIIDINQIIYMFVFHIYLITIYNCESVYRFLRVGNFNKIQDFTILRRILFFKTDSGKKK